MRCASPDIAAAVVSRSAGRVAALSTRREPSVVELSQRSQGVADGGGGRLKSITWGIGSRRNSTLAPSSESASVSSM